MPGRTTRSQFDLSDSEDRWYFAYGSNLSISRKEDRTGAIRRAAMVYVRDYRLTFNKQGSNGEVYANIMPAPGEEVWGVAYLCNPEAFAKLDRHEGIIGGHYRQQKMTVTTKAGKILTAIVYVAGDEYVVEEKPPSNAYLKYILDGAYEHGLSPEYISKIKRIAGRVEA